MRYEAVDHFGITVPDLDAAERFFMQVLDCDLWYREGPFEDPEGDSMTSELDVPPRARLRCSMLTTAAGDKVELLEYTVPEAPPSEPPPNHQNSAGHLAFRVTDIDAAVSFLSEQPGVALLEGPCEIPDGPSKGLRWIYFRTPWGLLLELVELPESLRSAGARPAS